MTQNPAQYLQETATESARARAQFIEECGTRLVDAARLMGETFKAGGKVLIFGNGGSAADAQHMAAELVGRMLLERRPLPAIALTTDTSGLTAIGNDYGYEHIFVKQVQALGVKGDIVVAISTSGNSKNVLLAVEAAKKQGCKVISMTGGSGGQLAAMSDISLNVAGGSNSCRVQESHIFAVHTVVDLMDRYFL